MKTAYIHADLFKKKADAFIVEDGRFHSFGKASAILKKDIDRIVDLKDAKVLPGFHDAHMHLLGTGMTFSMYDASRPASIEEMQRELKAHADGVPYLLGRGFHEERLDEKRSIEKQDLDAVSTSVPILITRACGHLIVANQAAIDRLEKPVPSELEADVDLKKGFFKEEARPWIKSVLPPSDIETLKRDILAAQDALLERGITAVGSDDFAVTTAPYELVLDAFKALHAKGELKLRVYEQVNLPLDTMEEFLQKGYGEFTSGRFRSGPLKRFIDGSLGARTALLRAPYEDADTYGTEVQGFSELKRLFTLASSHEKDVAVHAIGDMAVERFLDAAEASPHRKHPRHAIIHAQLADHTQIERMRLNGIGAQVQPVFIRSDISIAEARLGERLKDAYLFETMRQRVPTALSTDAPIEPCDPLLNLYIASTRSPGYNDRKTLVPEEAMPLPEAIESYTAVSAYFSRQEDMLGALERGQSADFVVVEGLDTDNPETIARAKVRETYIAGEAVFSEWT